MHVFGVVGRARSGKTTAVKAILKEAKKHELHAEVFEFGSYVLKEAIKVGKIPDKDREQLTPEEIEQLVILGSKRREERPDYWIHLLQKDIVSKNPDIALVPGVRFLNEAQAVRDLGGKIIRVVSYIVDGIEFISPDRNANHPSETEHYSIQADFFLTTRRGESNLLSRQAATLFSYLIEGADHAN